MQTANSAEQLLRKAEEIMTERGKQYDSTGQNRERSMGRIVAAFNCLYGTSMTEQQGWYFMLLVKLARQKDKPHADSMEDAIAYAALAAEAGFAALGAVRQCAVSVHPTIAALGQERDGLRNDIDKLEYAMQHMNDWRKIAESAQAETAEYRDRCYGLNTKLESLRNSLEVSERAAEATIAAADGRAEYWMGEAYNQKRAAVAYKDQAQQFEQLYEELRTKLCVAYPQHILSEA